MRGLIDARFVADSIRFLFRQAELWIRNAVRHQSSYLSSSEKAHAFARVCFASLVLYISVAGDREIYELKWRQIKRLMPSSYPCLRAFS